MKQIYNSKKNGPITVKKFFGRYAIKAGGCYQSGVYVNNLWRKVLKRVSGGIKIKSVLLLGLGGGGVIKGIRKRFGQVEIIAIEHDPVMVEIAKKTYLRKTEKIKIILEDAVKVIGGLEQKFDVILVDLFKGKTPAEVLKSEDFIEDIQKILNKNGYLLVNFYLDEKTLRPIFGRYFFQELGLRYWANKMAIYRHFGQGKVGDPLPKGFLFREQSLDYLKAIAYQPERKQFVVSGCNFAVKRRIGPICFENYFGDEEPRTGEISGLKIVSWQPLTKTGKPKGWHRNYLVGKPRQSGIIYLNNNQQYFKDWDGHAQRHRRKWLKDQNHRIEKIDYPEFKEIYQKVKPLGWILRQGFLKILEHHFKFHPDKISIFAGRETNSKKIIGALVVVDYEDISQSNHLISFIDREAGRTSVGVGLIDYWHQYCLEKKIRFLNFGIVWRRGDPKSWRGYSRFKKQFNLYLLNYPRSLVRIFWPKTKEFVSSEK